LAACFSPKASLLRLWVHGMTLRELIAAGEGLTNEQARRLLTVAQELVDDWFWEFPERIGALVDRYPDVIRRPF
jgi:endonuclease III